FFAHNRVNYQGQTVTVPASEAWGGSECMFNPSEWSSIQAESGGGNNPNAYNETYTQPNMSGSGTVNPQGDGMQLNSGLGKWENSMACEAVWAPSAFMGSKVAIEMAGGISYFIVNVAVSAAGAAVTRFYIDPCG
ncbi:MAG: hypothetical protein ACP5OR_09335, partial [Candidatus Dormibacteria bacterium]